MFRSLTSSSHQWRAILASLMLFTPVGAWTFERRIPLVLGPLKPLSAQEKNELAHRLELNSKAYEAEQARWVEKGNPLLVVNVRGRYANDTQAPAPEQAQPAQLQP